LGSAPDSHLPFHSVVIDDVFDATAVGGGHLQCRHSTNANSIAQQPPAQVRRR
jgi:hypothetical protein